MYFIYATKYILIMKNLTTFGIWYYLVFGQALYINSVFGFGQKCSIRCIPTNIFF